MKRLYFVRHGLSVMNAEGRWAGRTETPLTEEGRAQAKNAGLYARSLDLDYIISSPLSRALETATIIAKEIGFPFENIDINSLVVERDFGALEGQPWAPDLNIDGFSDVETRNTILERAKLTLEHVENVAATNVLIASHSAFGRAIRHITNPNIPLDAPEGFKNGEIIRLR